MSLEKLDVRCPWCNKLLCKLRAVPVGEQLNLILEEVGEIEFRCERCKHFVETRIADEYRKVHRE